MKIFDFIFSFIPLLMIILFLTRFILKVRKNNGERPKPLNIIEPVGKTDSDAVKTRPERILQTEPLLTESSEYRASPEGLNALEKNYTVMDAVPAVKAGGRSRISRLPELKKAVVWAEILGKPKSLD